MRYLLKKSNNFNNNKRSLENIVFINKYDLQGNQKRNIKNDNLTMKVVSFFKEIVFLFN